MESNVKTGQNKAAQNTGQKKSDAQTAEKTHAEKTYTEAEVMELIRAAVNNSTGRGSGENPPVVTLLYIAEVAPDNELELPGYGVMRPGSYLDVPKKEFGGQFMSTLARKLIDKRHLIVMDGLTEAERVRWNCAYSEGEVLDEETFDSFLSLPVERLGEIFEKLCPEHKRFVCCRMITAWERNDNRVGLEKVRLIDELANKTKETAGMLKPLKQACAAKLAE